MVVFVLTLFMEVGKVLNKEYLERREGNGIEEITPSESIAEAIENGLIVDTYQIIGQGKEAFVSWGKDKFGRLVAVKTYKLFKTTHRDVIHGTYRTNPYVVLSQFAKLEFYKNLDMFQANLPVPEPYKHAGYSYSMEFIGDENGPAPLLRDINKNSIHDPSDILEKCIDILHGMFQAHFVHGDFSEHNLLWFENEFVVIDFLQSKKFALKDAVPYGSPLIPISQAFRILQKDLNSFLPFFRRLFRIDVNYNEVLNYILGDIQENIDRERELSLETGS